MKLLLIQSGYSKMNLDFVHTQCSSYSKSDNDLQKIRQEIQNMSSELTDNTMNFFIKLISEQTKQTTLLIIPRDIIFEKPLTRQTDDVSCGVFALTYAISICYGKKPSNISFKLDNSDHNSLPLCNYLLRIAEAKRMVPIDTIIM